MTDLEFASETLRRAQSHVARLIMDKATAAAELLRARAKVRTCQHRVWRLERETQERARAHDEMLAEIERIYRGNQHND